MGVIPIAKLTGREGLDRACETKGKNGEESGRFGRVLDRKKDLSRLSKSAVTGAEGFEIREQRRSKEKHRAESRSVNVLTGEVR